MSIIPGFITKESNGVRVRLHVQPGAARSEIGGIHGDALKLRISARPEAGAANKAICAFFAELLSLPKNSVSILHGQSSRQKTIFIEGAVDQIMLTLEKALEP